jgi:hypothetical protein
MLASLLRSALPDSVAGDKVEALDSQDFDLIERVYCLGAPPLWHSRREGLTTSAALSHGEAIF